MLAIGLPIIGAIIAGGFIGLMMAGADLGGDGGNVLLLGGIGAISWLMGQRWYGTAGMGLRGKRPLYASIGFAVLGWLSFLVGRLVLVDSSGTSAGGIAQTFLYLLLFEAFCVQIWAFGLVFRSLADWQGPLPAALTSGVLFGVLATSLFSESYISGPTATLFFIVWGVFYGLIRLRTGSLLGMVIIQTMQSLTVWYILLPQFPPVIGQLQNFYLVCGFCLAIFVWRLWPKEEADYRV